MPGIDNDTSDVFSVSKRHASEGNVIIRKRQDIAIYIKVSVKLVDPVIRLLDIDDSIQILKRAITERFNQLL